MRRYPLVALVTIALGCSDHVLPTAPDSHTPTFQAAATPAGFTPAAGDRILIDTRTSLQQATDRASALRAFGYVGLTGGLWVFADDVDGRGTNALRLDWSKRPRNRCTYGNTAMSTALPAPHPDRVVVQWKHHLGRTPTGGGYGGIGEFALTDHGCPTGRTNWSMLRQANTNALSDPRRVDYMWTGASPVSPYVVRQGDAPFQANALADAPVQVEGLVGRTATHTLYLQRESAPGAGDGVVRLWIDGQLMLEDTRAALDAEPFRRIFFPGVAPLPLQRQSEYYWDVVVWEPVNELPGSGGGEEEPPVPVASSVTVSPSSATLVAGGTTDLVATVRDQNGQPMPDATVTWRSSNSAVASVNDAGRVTALATGEAVISATATGAVSASATSPSGSSTIVVSPVPPEPVASVEVSPSAASAQVGGTVQFSAIVRDASGNLLNDRAVTWATSDASVASVSASGLMTARAEGPVTITATSEGRSGSASVTVTRVPVASVAVAPASASMTIGGTVQLSATTRDANGQVLTGRSVTWASANPDLATVSATGLVTGRAIGTVTVTATSEGQSGSSSITITQVPVASVVVTPASASLQVGGTAQLSATASDANGNALADRPIAWTSSNDAVASVSASGLVTAKTAGTATITATSEGRSGTASVTVTNVPVATVAVTPATSTLAIGGTAQLTATLRDANGNTLTGRTTTWSSSNTTAATVSATGLVTARAAGSATITATSEGKSGTASVTVTQPAVASVTVSPTSATLETGGTRQFTATMRDASGNVLTGRAVTWTSSASAVATVSSSGLATAQGPGSATIAATSEGVSGTATVTVTAPPPPPPPVQGTYFVSPTGSDANPGSETAPFRTIQRAADVAQPGNVVIVENGVWTDTDGDGSVVAINRGGTASAYITFRARNKWGAKLDGQNGRAAQGFDFNNGVGWVRIEGFEIYGIANVGSPRGSASGIDAYDGGHDSQIVGNHIHDIGRVCTNSGNTNGEVGIFVQQPNLLIEENLIHDIGRFFPGENGCSYDSGFTGYMTLDHGIYLNGGSPGADGALIRNNIFYNTRHGWAIQWYPGSLSNIRVVNNTFAYGNPNKNYTHIVLDASISNSSIVNNVFYNPEGGRTIEAAGFSGSITIANNITTGSAMTDRSSTPTGMTLSGNLLSTDARFVNAAGRDFHLSAGSPAINAGQATSLSTRDFDGRARPQGGAYDMGAYEQ